MANRNNSNKLLVSGAENALNKMKLEIAAELGLEDYDNMDKGALPSRINGMVGGSMTKRLVEMGQQMLAGESTEQTNNNYQQYKEDAMEDLNNTH